MTAKLISIIGPPAVGKTTLAERLGGIFNAPVIREDYEGNPFLAESYLSGGEASLPAQLYYLMSRVSQLALTTWPNEGVVVSDYGFCHDAVYAKMKLAGEELALYEQVSKRLQRAIKPPDLVLYVDASVILMTRRITQRGREFEKAFTPEFLRRLRAGYRDLVNDLGCPVIGIDGDLRDLRRFCKMDPITAEIRETLSL
ncbi:MAG: deoxynucleoside kinase [Planctomycetota bacterium]